MVIPASVALFVLAGPLTVAIFHYGKFSAQDVHMTQMALMAYSFALLGWSLIKVLAPGFFARQDTKTPMRIAMWSLGITMGLNLLFVLGAYRFQIRVRVPQDAAPSASAGLSALSMKLYFENGIMSIPPLFPGRNNLRLRIADPAGYPVLLVDNRR